MKKVIHFTILILLLNICFLFSPKPKPETNFCGEYISLNDHMGFIRNCDAIGFTETAISPSALMRKNDVRQNRPLYIIVGSWIGYSIYYLSSILNGVYELSLYKSIYLAYICLNFGLLLLSLILFEKIAVILTNNKIPYTAVLILAVFIVSNFMTKAFFWTAHQQMMAFLIPLLSIYISISLIDRLSKNALYILFFMLGMGMLVYGSFLILFFVFILQLFYIYVKNKTLLTLSSMVFFTICCLLFLLPILMWVLFLKYNEITYYNHEVVQYRQLVWIIDALVISFTALASALYLNIVEFIKTIPKLYTFIVLFLSVLVVKKVKTRLIIQWNRNTILILLNLFCFGCFFMMLGYYANRLTFTLMPIILSLSLAQVDDLLKNKNVQVALFVLVCIWHSINVFSYGPFS